METRYYATCLWPGLPEIWWRGKLSALPSAIGFAVAINLLLISRYIYPELLPSSLVSMAFWLGCIAWIFYVVRSIRELPALLAPRTIAEEPDRFAEARDAYLAGEWEAAEKLLTSVLAIEPRDPPALLMLTGVYRHTDRLEGAEMLLEEISRLEVADTWWLEVNAEARRLQRAIQQANEEKEEQPADLTEETRLAA